MPFDPSTANAASGFDPSSAKSEASSAPTKKAPEKSQWEKIAPYYLGPFATTRLALEGMEWLDKKAYDAGGWITDKASILGASPEVAAGTGVLGNMAVQAAPSIISGLATKAATTPALRSLGRWAMQSAVKPDKAARLSGDAAKGIETMLKEGVNVTPGGMAKLSNEVRVLAGQVDDAIMAAEKGGAKVSVTSVLKPWSEKLKEVSGQINNADDVAAVKKVLSEFLTDPRVQGKTEIPIKVAQDMKTATYKALGRKAYGNELASSAVEGQKAVVRGLKEGIERSAPSVIERNSRMQELLNAIEVVEPRALGAGNNNFTGLSLLAENPFAGGAMMLDRSSLLKSILGRGFYTPAPSILGAGAGTATGAYMQ